MPPSSQTTVMDSAAAQIKGLAEHDLLQCLAGLSGHLGCGFIEQ